MKTDTTTAKEATAKPGKTDVPPADSKEKKPTQSADKPKEGEGGGDKKDEKPKEKPLGAATEAFLNRAVNTDTRKALKDAADKDAKGEDPFSDKKPADPKDDKKPKEKPKAKPEDKPKADKKEGDEPTDDDEPKPKTKPRTEQPVIDTDKLGAAIAKGIEPLIKGREQKEEKTEDKKPDGPKLTIKQERRVEIFRQLEKMYSDSSEYKGIADRYLSNIKTWDNYVKKWEGDHPNETFDADAPEHAALREKLDSSTDYDEDEYLEALTSLNAEKIVKERESKSDQRISKIEMAENARQKKVELEQTAEAATDSFYKNLGDDFAELINEQGIVTGEAMTKLKESNPVHHQIIVNNAGAVEHFTQQAYALINKLVEPDVKNEHRFVSAFAWHAEQSMLGRETKDQLDVKGRQFVPRDQWNKMSEDEREKHWTFTPADLGAMLSGHFGKVARDQMDAEDSKIAALLEAKGIDPTTVVKKRKPEKAEKGGAGGAGNSDDDDGKPESPSAAASPRVAARNKTDVNPPKNAHDAFFRRATNQK